MATQSNPLASLGKLSELKQRLLFVVGGLMTVPIGAYVMRSARRNRVAE